MQEKQFRNRISWLMFGFSVLVIWVHSYNTELFAGTRWGAAWDCAAGIENFWSVGIGQIAVPGFFMLSSYLFFRNFTLAKLAGKWKSRFFSVVVPYAVWNLLYYLGYVVATRLPMVQKVVGKDPVLFNIEETLRAVVHYGYAPIFWYLYQLIILLVLAPMVYVLVKNRVVGGLYLLALVWALKNGLGTGRPNTDALFYFSVAAYGAVHWKTWIERKGTWDRFMAGVGVFALAVYCYGTRKVPGADVLWTIFYRLLATVSLWLMISSLELPDTKPWMRMSMFLYGIHFIVVRFVNKGAALVLVRVLPEEVQERWMHVFASGIYFMLPGLAIAVAYVLALILSRWMPFVWRMLSGGRNLES